MSNKVAKILRAAGACPESIEWSRRYKTPLGAWKACKRADWMVWYCAVADMDRRKIIRVIALCLEKAIPFIRDNYTAAEATALVQLCVAYAEGEATEEELVAQGVLGLDSSLDPFVVVAALATVSRDSTSLNSTEQYGLMQEMADLVRAYYPAPPGVGQ